MTEVQPMKMPPPKRSGSPRAGDGECADFSVLTIGTLDGTQEGPGR